MNKRSILTFTVIFAALALIFITYQQFQTRRSQTENRKLKVYWFIPDGLRAEPDVFQIYRWADEGLLPNLKKMMAQGSYGYSIPTFPGHTPINFATLLTGASPKTHGVADGPIHLPGYPLSITSLSGFSSAAKKVPPLPYTLEERDYKVAVLSVPGTTPPELDRGITLRGRWGGWGIDFPATIFQSPDRAPSAANFENRVFYSGPELTLSAVTSPAQAWQVTLPKSHSPAQEVVLTNWGTSVHAYIYDSLDDGRAEYDRVLFSLDKKSVYADLGTQGWSPWLPLELKYEMQNDYNVQTPKKKEWERSLSAIQVPTFVKIKVIKLGVKGFYRIRFFYDNLNEFSVQPSLWSDRLQKDLGPMVDFPDSYPAQLVHHPEDKTTFLEESTMSLEWHKNLARFAIQKMSLNAVIHNIYSPNQMLTSRWWTGFVDPKSRRYGQKTPAERDELMSEIKKMYQQVDEILGQILENADPDTVIVFSSDHGAVPLDKEVRLNNLFAKNGLLKFNLNKTTKTYEVDWARTKAVFLKMDGVYLNPKGLGGNYQRASGPEYEKLRDQVILILSNLTDTDGTKPLEKILKWEDAGELQLPTDRVGDLVIANLAGYNWTESMSNDGVIFTQSDVTGYKQTVLGENNPGMWTPFVIMGPGVKKGVALAQPIHHIEQYPTIMKLLGEALPEFVEGRPIHAVLENP